MREILFRGKHLKEHYWIVGYYLIRKFPSFTDHSIWTPQGTLSVIPETVGQFTGLTDKNGNKIFEGDVHRQEIEHNTGDERHYFACTWLEEFGCFSWIDILQYQDYIDNGLIAIEWMLNDGIPLHIDFEDCKKIEIIGNIHEDGNK